MWNRPEMNTPMMTLELRITPLVRHVVQSMMLSDEEAQASIEEAIKSAVSNFNWREQIRQQVQATLDHEVANLFRGLVSKLAYDEELSAHFKKAIISALAKQGGV